MDVVGQIESILSGLTEHQREAVTHGEGPLLVLAGAGTGKTRTLVYRVCRLIEDGVPPGRILLLTFTNKAAKEMLERVAQLVERGSGRVMGGTFHSVGHRILRRYADRIDVVFDADPAGQQAAESPHELAVGTAA